MGTLLFSEFRTDLRYALEQRSDLDPSDSTAKDRLNRWINRAYRWVSLPAVYEHPELKTNDTITLVDGTDSYALPSDLYAIRFIVNETQDFKYDPEQSREWLDRSGKNQSYAREGNNILIEGTDQNDADTVRVYYWAFPTDLAADGSTTSLGDYFDDVILARASAIGSAALGELDRADWYNSYAAELINDHTPPESFEVRDSGWRNEHIRQGTSAMGGRR